MTEPYHQKTIELGREILGSTIIEAVRAMAADSTSYRYEEKRNPGESRPYTIGFSSMDPARHVAILTGENLDKPVLVPSESYSRIAVGTYNQWGGMVWAINVYQDSVERAVNEIAADLESRL